MSEFLRNFIKENDIVQHGEFRLASGKKSDFYCDVKKLSLDSFGLLNAVPDLFRLLGKTAQFDAVGGLELGAVPLVGAILMYAGLNTQANLKGFIVRKNPKEHGTQKFIEGPVKPGMKVAVIEDVATSGGSAHLAYIRAKDFGLEPVIVGCVINRKEGADELFQSLGIPFVYLLDKTQL